MTYICHKDQFNVYQNMKRKESSAPDAIYFSSNLNCFYKKIVSNTRINMFLSLKLHLYSCGEIVEFIKR